MNGRDAIVEALFHDQRRRHPGHVLGKKRCEEIVAFIADRLAPEFTFDECRYEANR